MAYHEGIIKNAEFFTTSELAKKLKMNVQVITRKVQGGEILAYKIGKDWRIPEQSVYDWLERNSNRKIPASRRKPQVKAPVSAEAELPTSNRNTRRFLLEYILAQFEPSKTYTEDDVNRVIARYHNDFSSIRREFMEAKMMDRVNGMYRRRTGYRFSD